MSKTLFLQVEKALESIRPYLISDGGNVKLLEITKDNIVQIELEGSCVSCPMSSLTMRAGIEKAIKESLPQIKAVVAVNTTKSEAALEL